MLEHPLEFVNQAAWRVMEENCMAADAGRAVPPADEEAPRKKVKFTAMPTNNKMSRSDMRTAVKRAADVTADYYDPKEPFNYTDSSLDWSWAFLHPEHLRTRLEHAVDGYFRGDDYQTPPDERTGRSQFDLARAWSPYSNPFWSTHVPEGAHPDYCWIQPRASDGMLDLSERLLHYTISVHDFADLQAGALPPVACASCVR
jgi:hypothetical protein